MRATNRIKGKIIKLQNSKAKKKKKKNITEGKRESASRMNERIKTEPYIRQYNDTC